MSVRSVYGRNIHHGTAGEHLVCADLLTRGGQAFLTSAGMAYDVVGEVGGRLLRIAVKATIRPICVLGRAPGRSVYRFSINRRDDARYTDADTDLIALVGLDRKLVCYLSVYSSPTILELDEPGTTLRRPGTRRGQSRIFEDFPLDLALFNWSEKL